jgi:hypothetical protein
VGCSAVRSGPIVTDDPVTVCVQHPGEGDEYSIDKPLTSVVAVWKADGQIGV